MTDLASDIFDDLFFGCAFAAYLEQAAIQQDWPDMEATRRLAYRYYEKALAARNSRWPSQIAAVRQEWFGMMRKRVPIGRGRSPSIFPCSCESPISFSGNGFRCRSQTMP